ncbi:hypothetical protein HOB10_01975 [Candidatus Parcubacteria bacterium]|jgi:hypothetical protein|nr:hypothetical protein [Candidatus Parcubacteria bacterium]
MKLEFFREDLLPEYKDIPTSQVSFQHLDETAQAVLRIVGRGVFYTASRDNYNAVYPPKTETVVEQEGVVFEVDIEACSQFGCQHGDRIKVDGVVEIATVVGVAPLPNGEATDCMPAGQDVLWVRLDGQEKVCFFPNPEGRFHKAE